MPNGQGDFEAKRLAAIVAAVQAFLAGEEQASRRSGGVSAWRRAALLATDDAFSGRERSWTGRD